MGLAAGTTAGVQAVLFYLVVYVLMNLGAFAAVIVVSNAVRTDLVEGYAGLYRRAPFLAVVLAAALLSLAGMPPLAGFLAKFLVFAAAVEKGLMWLVIVAVVNSVMALYYYLRIIRVSFLNEPKENTAILPSRGMTLTLGLLLFGILFLGLWPQPVLLWLSAAYR
jgi:NADH-quinone oxidoreductase subunit N